MQKKIKDYTEYDSNPFPLIDPDSDTHLMAISQGEVCGYITKNLQQLKGLPRLAFDILMNIPGKLESGHQEALIPLDTVQKEIREYKTTASYYRAIRALLEKGYIARKKYHNSTFYINPEIVITSVK